MKQRRTTDIHATAALVGWLPQSYVCRALIAGQRVYRVALTTVPKENS
jgi:hypothetical protein